MNNFRGTRLGHVPLRRESSATPGERWGARTGVLVSCGGSCKGVRCRSAAARRRASIAGSGATRPQIPPKALGPARAALARRRAPHRPPPVDRGPPTMTKGRRRLKYALIITCTIACPVGLDNGEVCSGHGACAEHVSKGIDETCVCDYGFSGPDCSLRLCPAARAWSDYASSNNTAHAKHVECANMGESRRPAVLRCLHAIDATRFHQTRSWVVYISNLSEFGPRRETAMLHTGRSRRSRARAF